MRVILKQGHGKVRLLKPDELQEDWDPDTDDRLTNWETVHHLIRVLASGGESAASELVAKLGSKAENARELAYRLYTLCERKKRATDALAYNGRPKLAGVAAARAAGWQAEGTGRAGAVGNLNPNGKVGFIKSLIIQNLSFTEGHIWQILSP